MCLFVFFFFQAEDGIRAGRVTGVQTCALPISRAGAALVVPRGGPVSAVNGAVTEQGWRQPRVAPSLVEVYRTIPVAQGAWWRKALAFSGPGYLVAVGYMDPGNWATDL